MVSNISVQPERLVSDPHFYVPLTNFCCALRAQLRSRTLRTRPRARAATTLRSRTLRVRLRSSTDGFDSTEDEEVWGLAPTPADEDLDALE